MSESSLARTLDSHDALPALARAAPRPFLGVTRSALGRMWRDRCDEAQALQALAMVQQYGLPDMVARVLAARGVAPGEALAFLEPRLRDLMPDPSVLRDMDAAVVRLVAAVKRCEQIAIFGDYDVDGACSAALLGGFLGRCGVPYVIHIPDRLTEGYGPNMAAVSALREAGARLLVTVDCGTASHAVFAHARELGMDVVVIDHHQAPAELPVVEALVNPNRQDDLSGLGHLAAAGVVFLVLVALNRALREAGFWRADRPQPDLLAELDLVALATVADVVPLRGLNRAFVRQGLAVMRRRGRPGLTALMDTAALSGPPEAWHLGFLLGPRINAGGRIGDAALGARLLLTFDEAVARATATELDRLNKERQAIELVAVEEAMAQADMALSADPDRAVLVVHAPDWHPGVVGLVAARVKERFQKPTFAFAANGEGGLTGSGRSIPGVDLGAAVRRLVEAGQVAKGGGHAMAAGVTLADGNLAAFAEAIDALLRDSVAVAGADTALLIDGAMTAASATTELMARLNGAGPFGSGHPEPVFAFPNHILTEAAVVGNGHVRLRLRAGDGSQVGGIAFRAADQPLGRALLASRGERVHAAGSLAVDRWGGAERVDVRVADVAPATPGKAVDGR